ncbi:hybrid sensor histidine kinase/response regulator [Limnoglobus roseus]|uniref:histidine kinase n=1 Tax=Limnoglobus roseus TaxID=2598579 RepID=A0A5C1AD42_9BACT|nr:Hpt domain-containing protein [Limnoglobus roseus]QEL16620.1 hybrid sensor histidine kinase/response regulator [Limnoglobus roseus]
MSSLEEELRAAFRTEHAEYLIGLRAFFGEAGGPVDVNEAFRMAHSLKAAARACDLDAVGEVGHRLETILGRVRKGTLTLGPDARGAARAALDATEAWAAGGTTPPSAGVYNSLDAVLSAIGQTSLPPAVTSGSLPPWEGGSGRGVSQTVSGDSLPPPDAGSTPHPNPPPQGGREQSRPPADNSDDLTDRLRAAFRAEHVEHLEGIRAVLTAFESGNPPADWVNDAFRRAHSLKGAARIAEAGAVEALAHRMETLFARVREGTLGTTPALLRAVRLGLDVIEDTVAVLGTGQAAPESAAAQAAIEQVIGGAPQDDWVGHPVAGRESAVERPGSSSPPPAVPRPPPSDDTVRVGAGYLDRLLRSAAQLRAEALQQGIVGRDLAALDHRLSGLGREWAAVRGGAAAELRRLAASPEFARVARYLAFVEQEVKTLGKTARGLRRDHRRGAWALRQLGGQVHRDARVLRMATAEGTFQGFGKMVRDLARDAGKEVEFRAVGLDLQADREVLQALKDPLMHMLANAVTHGLERPAERAAAGKPATGRVALRLEAAGNRLRVWVEDDGRGIDPRAVGETAVRRGLLTAAEVAGRSADELARLIFEPGFSTAAAVTGTAGRGMGLSVVHEAVARLQGDVEVLPADGPGTRIVLTVPLSVSTRRVLLVSCRGRTYAIPADAIDRLVRAAPGDTAPVEGKPMFLGGGRPVPVVDLARLLGADGEPPATNDTTPLAVLRARGRWAAVVVDAFVAERDAMVRPLDGPAARVPTFAGGVILEDGSVALVLNPAELMTDAAAHRPAQPIVPALRVKKPPTVLVVDDSLTTRTLEKSILEVHGYTVRIAVDGMEALAALRTELPDLVITDVEMPRLNGFGLLAEMKKDPRLARLPVIVVTSLAKREDQERGMALGADAYIVKRKFDHEELLETIRQIL